MFKPENGEAIPLNAVLDFPSEQPRQTLVPAVDKAFRLLVALGDSAEPLGVSQLSRTLGLGKSTVHGLVTTLETLGIIESPSPGKRYRLGPGLFALASRSAGQRDLRNVARPALERLAAATEQTSFLGVPADDHVTILDLIHGRPTMSISAPIGSAIPLLAGAVGKAIVSAWDQQRRDEFLQDGRLPAFTANTIREPGQFMAAVDAAASEGAAIDIDEYVDGMRAAAASIFGPTHELVAVIWVAGFSRHVDRERLAEMAKEVAREATDISKLLGGLT
ncbi:MAG: IclR family transcriptional regulator [Candidatus Eremiobacteraeota bacterium]|nr:IclR family transcriptional regulator [Candidatus Eremiobacteraeota bacterium]